VIGLGYIGLPTAVLIARAGFSVIGYDANASRIDRLNRGVDVFEETELNAITAKFIHDGSVKVFSAPDQSMSEADIYIICVPTPITSEKKPDISIVQKATEFISHFIKPGNMVLLESTSPVGTTRDVVSELLKTGDVDPEVDLDIAYCPERVLPGNTIQEITRNDRVVGGRTERAAERAKQFYATFCHGNIMKTNAETAEFSKLSENTFRDINIALANELEGLAQEMGINIREVIKIANRHPRVNIHSPGSGVGGHCIPIDPWFLHYINPKISPLIRTARHINDQKPIKVISDLDKAHNLNEKNVAVLGYSYRGDIGDWRDSPAITAVDYLLKTGAIVNIYDPFVEVSEVPNRHRDFFVERSNIFTKADIIIIMTAHSEFKSLDLDELQKAGQILCDPVGLIL
jgi:UDP-N-acetyl-D-mannosaminuronic acid dehydrogenase